ncbi:RHS repeat-associated core domain-containing protein [Luteibacter sp. SG786]|uniref:RHS repeat-associated core domain-containing protein n=1 Tax=Luteibacter sp. SG786 TaxID=2587130 RepID=UPI001421BAE1|nr:RHS repeat-associated core domain-containing protein [Luteibacter sp. SG786]NII54901.1 RHS repeat-associated protein [Luteibacter sp. SG786]
MPDTASLHSHTPVVSAVDPRGLGIRSIAYLRTTESDEPTPLVRRSQCNVRGQQEMHWDPRLWKRFQENAGSPPTGNAIWSLSGKPLHVSHVDSGRRVAVFSAADNPVQIWDSRGTIMRYAFDDQLRPVSTHEHMAGASDRCVERFTYGAADAPSNRRGLLIRHDDTAGTTTAVEYTITGAPLDDTRRFLATMDVPDWPEDVAQRDAMLEADAWTTRYGYNALSEVMLHTDARGNTQRSVRGVDGSLGQVWLGLAGGVERCLLREMVIDAEGAPVLRIDGNGIQRHWEFAPADHRLKKSSARRGSDMLQDLSYAYDAAGNIVSTDDAAQPITYFSGRKVEPVNTYRYDTLYRLIGATGRESVSPATGPGAPAWQLQPGEAVVGYQQTYEYDDGNNLLSLRHAGAQSYTRRMAVADTSNRSMPLDDGQPPPDLADGFDANGNLRNLQPGQELVWNGRNMLFRTTQLVRAHAAGDNERYAYNGVATRVRKLQTILVGGQWRTRDVRYLPGLEWRTDQVTGERLQVICTEIAGGTVRTLHWEGGTVPPGMENDTDRYAVTDHLGSCTLEIDGNASLISHEWYHPYGSTAGCVARNRIEASYKSIHYSGKERDDSGLHYYGFRYYASWLMRWIAPDPAGDVDGQNRFAMVGGNPVTRADASGLAPSEDGEGPERGATVFDSALREFIITMFAMAFMLLFTIGGEFAFPTGESSDLAHATMAVIAGMVATAGWFAGASGRNQQTRGIGWALALGGAGLTAGPYLLAMFGGNPINDVVTNMFATSVYALVNALAQRLFGEAGNSVDFGGRRAPGGIILANGLLGAVAYGGSAFIAGNNRVADFLLGQPLTAGALKAGITAISVRHPQAEINSGRRRISPVNGRDAVTDTVLRMVTQNFGDLMGLLVKAILARLGIHLDQEDYRNAQRFFERFSGNLGNELLGPYARPQLPDHAQIAADEALEASRPPDQGGDTYRLMNVSPTPQTPFTPDTPGPTIMPQFTFGRSRSQTPMPQAPHNGNWWARVKAFLGF